MTTNAKSVEPYRPVPGRTTHVPKYYAVKQQLLAITQALQPGSPMPAERLLAVRFSTSRTTLRQALQELVGEGRLHRIHGKGTFVAPPKLHRNLHLTSHTEDMLAQGLKPASEVLDIGEVTAGEKLSRLLGIGVGEPALFIERLQLASNSPVAIETTHLSARRFPGLLQSLALYPSLYAALAKMYGVYLTEADETIETSLATPREAELLATDVGLPMLLLSRHSRDADGAPVEWTRSVYRGSRYKFVATLRRPFSPSATSAHAARDNG
ncbi:GntR family transcriptional regulator [Streptomyces sp. R08]|uniref:GntR family transcriptional regulator n=1 Tax=Streptomyces sp. R08 TaxID=3238624 RepID=A0AB39MRF7_9ACTN